MGNYGKGGVGEFGYAESIADGRITVPAFIWKVILVLPKGKNDLDRVDSNTRVIAVDIENTDELLDTRWYNYRTSIDDIEAETGLDILSNLPLSIQGTLEAHIDDVLIE